ncbi:hypothetical protein [Pseudomonas sp. C9-3]|uniref:hypothetical protein n=1 Tax=Pseudomonas sp. C9-3 TaxID=3078264 RepID=UPI0028EAFDAD|nr:hypothetical protein [Pseudomonas sp. C9-3]
MEKSTAIQNALKRLQFTCLDEWAGGEKPHRFRCSQGHTFTHLGKVLYTMKECVQCSDDKKLLRLQRKADEDGSELLDTQWTGWSSHYRFRCRKDPSHEWQRLNSMAVTNSQCPHCAPRGRKRSADGLQRLQDYARERGGECLSPSYLGITQAHRFRCSSGHTWEVVAGVVLKSNRWCPTCRGNLAFSIEDAKRSAQQRGGDFLSEQYLNIKTYYSWRCAQGHVWQAPYKTIVAGSWCPLCSFENRKLGVQSLQQAATERGGKCLSTTYHTSVTKYRWLCAKGHTWSSTLQHVRQGSWCPTCYHMSRTKPGSLAWRRYQTHQPRD